MFNRHIAPVNMRVATSPRLPVVLLYQRPTTPM